MCTQIIPKAQQNKKPRPELVEWAGLFVYACG